MLMVVQVRDLLMDWLCDREMTIYTVSNDLTRQHVLQPQQQQ